MPVSLLYRQFERLVIDGFPEPELAKEIEVRCVPLYDYELGGAVDEWLKSRGSESKVEKDLNKGGRLANALKQLEREWSNWRRVKTLERLEQQRNGPRKCMLFFGLLGVLCALATLILAGGDELMNKTWPRLVMFARTVFQEMANGPAPSAGAEGGDGHSQQPKHQQQQQSNNGGSILPAPPTGFVSWVTWGSKKLGARDVVARLRSGSVSDQRRCTCGEYSHTGHQSEQEPDDQPEEASSDSTAENRETAAENGMDNGGEKDDQPQQQKQQQGSSQAGRRFIARAANVFRKATGTLHVENTHREESSNPFGKQKGDKKKRMDGSGAGGGGITRGVLQPAFLLESNEDAFRQHVALLADRFDPPLPIVDMVWRDLSSPEQLSDFLYWNTGWGSIRGGNGGGAAACCIILSLPNAIAPIARVRNVTRESSLPALVEKLSSVASKQAVEVQGNVGCRVIVVARVDPTTSDIRSKRTYKRMRNLFASFIL